MLSRIGLFALAATNTIAEAACNKKSCEKEPGQCMAEIFGFMVILGVVGAFLGLLNAKPDTYNEYHPRRP